MASTSPENTPLLPRPTPSSSTSQQHAVRPHRTLSFDPIVTSRSIPARVNDPLRQLHSATPSMGSTAGSTPVLTALNSKLRRRHSQPPVTSGSPAPKIGPQRTTKNTQKLKLLPNPPLIGEKEEGEVDDEGVPLDVYSQITRIKEPTARRDAARLGKADRDRLPRVSAYCTANSYRLESVMKFFKGRARSRGANPKLIDECVYSPYNYDHDVKRWSQARPRTDESIQTSHPLPPSTTERRFSDSEIEIMDRQNQPSEDLINLRDDEHGHDAHERETHYSSQPLATISETHKNSTNLDTTIHTPEVFLFNYGTVVIWGMTPAQEQRFLKEISKFANSLLSAEDMQVENFNFYYTRDYQPRIYNDFISLRDPYNYMTKLAISHALAQSVKTSLFEDLVSETIAITSPLPAQIAQTGSVNMTRRQINMQIGELFILRINIHLQGSVLDSPELMWAEPQLDPVYQAVRSYLEMDQRVGLLNERLDVIADLLAVLKDQLSHRHGEYLEWIIIILIAAEILVAAINIVVDLYAGFD
ncbi:hypothetical protein AJ80_05448 [Polytolypa hystricis UAMH7299]|uniref:DUF155 domain-containing protein n=1 Tax=Polytolypa hystricis (strain UAMH7299) TaxID=1447883 RepID=A0A2B7Y3B7_POLH7|nr:hypothetical protein AJ80_05448 [Polytolypa hystricis UAMH7299]